MLWFDRIVRAAFASPLLWGAIMTAAVYAGLDACGESVDPLLQRWLTGRWEALLIVSLFLIALAALAIKAIYLVREAISQHRAQFQQAVEVESPTARARRLLDQLGEGSVGQGGTCVRRGLCDALQFVVQSGSHEALDERVKYWADSESTRMHTSYGLPRILIWAIPAIGSFGTVLGIARAVTALSLETSPDPVAEVTAGLGEAFDTFALALAASIVLMLIKWFCEHCESQLLAAAEHRVRQELLHRFGGLATPRLSQFEQLRRLTQSVIDATEKLAQHQATLWQDSLQRANDQWENGTAAIGEQLEGLVHRAVVSAVEGRQLGTLAANAPGSPSADWGPLQQALEQIANFMARQQAKQEQEGQVLTQLIEMIDEGSATRPVRPRLSARGDKPTGQSLVELWQAVGE